MLVRLHAVAFGVPQDKVLLHAAPHFLGSGEAPAVASKARPGVLPGEAATRHLCFALPAATWTAFDTSRREHGCSVEDLVLSMLGPYRARIRAVVSEFDPTEA